jgi:hypothetical protein
VLHQGWGPKALNMNVLRNPEILATMPNVTKDLMGWLPGLNIKITPKDKRRISRHFGVPYCA